MRRIVCLLTVLLLCAALACPAFAAEDAFVPSISYKDGPEIEDAELETEDVASCLVITSVRAAQEKTTDIYQEDRDLLLEVYAKLDDGTMKLPLEGSYVIRELVDLSFQKTPCVESDHTHKEDLTKEGVTITVDFDLGVTKDTKVEVLSYHDGEWSPIESVTVNDDGTVTCVFEHFCPVAFCVEAVENPDVAPTGDTAGRIMGLWAALMAVSAAAVAVLTVRGRKIAA